MFKAGLVNEITFYSNMTNTKINSLMEAAFRDSSILKRHSLSFNGWHLMCPGPRDVKPIRLEVIQPASDVQFVNLKWFVLFSLSIQFYPAIDKLIQGTLGYTGR